MTRAIVPRMLAAGGGRISIMGPLIVWLASAAASGMHDERIVATEFADWLAQRHDGRAD